jgi:nascent polypeptide-associated complex subunit beta
MEDLEVKEARERLAAKFGAENLRMGGKGSMRKKKKVAHKSNQVDDKKVKSAIKKLGVQPLQGIDEVNFFQDDNTILNFENPQIEGNIKDNFFVISGKGQVKSLRDLMPGIIPQLGPKNFEFLKEFLTNTRTENADDEVPDLVGTQNFEDIAAQD